MPLPAVAGAVHVTTTSPASAPPGSARTAVGAAVHTSVLAWNGCDEPRLLRAVTVRLAVIEDLLNTMPRKLHDWDSPHSVYAALSRNDRWSLPTWRLFRERAPLRLARTRERSRLDERF